MLYAVSVVVTTHKDGWSSPISMPTFYLDENVQGITNSDHAKRIATRMFTSLGHDAADISVSVCATNVPLEDRPAMYKRAEEIMRETGSSMFDAISRARYEYAHNL